MAVSRRKEDVFVGASLREWAGMEGNAGRAGVLITSAIRVMSYSQDFNALNDAAENLRLAALMMNRAAGWPENGR